MTDTQVMFSDLEQTAAAEAPHVKRSRERLAAYEALSPADRARVEMANGVLNALRVEAGTTCRTLEEVRHAATICEQAATALNHFGAERRAPNRPVYRGDGGQ